MTTPDGYASLPYESSLPHRPYRPQGRARRAGAVRVDLSFADKSIRRPGSAPDLVNNRDAAKFWGTPADNKKVAALKNRGRSTSSERESVMRKPGVSPATRKVAFAGLEDDDDSDTESEKDMREGGNDFRDEIWVKQPESHKRAVKESVTVNGGSKLSHGSCNGSR